jgi:hypothetical protein
MIQGEQGEVTDTYTTPGKHDKWQVSVMVTLVDPLHGLWVDW